MTGSDRTFGIELTAVLTREGSEGKSCGSSVYHSVNSEMHLAGLLLVGHALQDGWMSTTGKRVTRPSRADNAKHQWPAVMLPVAFEAVSSGKSAPFASLGVKVMRREPFRSGQGRSQISNQKRPRGRDGINTKGSAASSKYGV